MHGAILKIALCIVQCLRHRPECERYTKEHDSFLIIISTFYHFGWSCFAFWFCLSCSLLGCNHLCAVHHYVLFSPPIRFIARKVNIYFDIGIQCAVIVGCEKKHILFLFISFTFISEWVNLLCSQSHFGMPLKKKWLLVLIKSRLAAQIRRRIYFGFNGSVHLICLRLHCLFLASVEAVSVSVSLLPPTDMHPRFW